MINQNYLYRISEFAVGLLFGMGLMASGMTDPRKVIGFLDFSGQWDPSLAMVMGGAVIIGFFAFTIAKKRKSTFLGGVLRFPLTTKIDKPLVIGSLLFGTGWGLAGFCPGPALVSMADGQSKALVSVVAMLVGMLGFELMDRFVHTPRKAKLKPV